MTKLYHGTNPLALSKIRKTGLCSWDKTGNVQFRNLSKDGIYFTSEIRLAGRFTSTWPTEYIPPLQSENPKYSKQTQRVILRVDRDEIESECDLFPDPNLPSDSFIAHCPGKCTTPKSAEVCFLPFGGERKNDAEDYCTGKWKPFRWNVSQ